MTAPTPLPAGARILVAGATGHLGRHVVRAFRDRGWRVRALTRRPGATAQSLGADEAAHGDLLRPDTLPTACAGADAVFSCAGASLDLRALGDRRTCADVDAGGNVALLRAAERAGVPRFAYVSLAGGPSLVHTEYARAHETVVDALARAAVARTVVRPTGSFWMMEEILRKARSGRAAVVGDASARTNPIHEADLAEACADAVAAGVAEAPVGGPDVLTREEIARLALAAVGKPPRVAHVPPAVARAMTAVARPLHPLIAAVLEFGTAVGLADVVAPTHGTRTLGAHFRGLAGR